MKVYPRLSDSDGRVRLLELRNAPTSSLPELVRFDHPSAAPVATGGVPVTAQELSDLRQSVVGSLEARMEGPFLSRSEASAFDREMGRSLHQEMDIVPSDAAHREVWTFLTVMVFPDLLARRFSDMSEERALGGQRNVLRRSWEREAAIGDLQRAAVRPLSEDELVGLFERTALSRNLALVRALARRVMGYDGPQRTAYARELYKEATYLTGPLLLDSLDEDEVQVVVDDIDIPLGF